MADPFPLVELPLIDLTIRMFAQPRLEGDRALLREIHSSEILNKNERLYNLGVGEKELASADKFAALLEAEGIAVDRKPGKLKDIPTLAKTDPFMMELLDHDDERIRDLAQARLDVKSTINETRSARLGGMADRGALAVYLHYCGAHTRRWSGGDDLNFQNLGRQSRLRRALRAPEGFLIAAPDQSQGECRTLNWFAGQDDVIERFAKGANPYEPIASKFYGFPVKKTEHPMHYGLGKQLELSCGYGAGTDSIQFTAKKGTYGPSIELSKQEALAARDLYRSEHRHVVGLWKEAQDHIIPLLFRKGSGSWRKDFSIENGRIYHPNGTWLDYRGLRWEEGDWRFYRGKSWEGMYGSKLAAHIAGWLSRVITCEAMVKFARAGYPVVGMSHDDVWLLVPVECDHPTLTAEIIRIMSETPSWAPGLPLAAECKIGQTYGG